MAPTALLLTVALAAAPAVDAPLAPVTPAQHQKLQWRSTWVALTGVGLIGVGGALWVVGTRQHSEALRSDAALGQAQTRVDGADRLSLGGNALIVVGACVLGWAVVMGESLEAPVSVAVAPIPGGGAFVFSGALP